MEQKNNQKNLIPQRKKVVIIVSFVLAILIAFTGGVLTNLIFKNSYEKSVNPVLKIIDKAGIIYDPVLDDYRAVTDKDILTAIASGIDEYSAYYTKEEYQALTVKDGGIQNGIGISFTGDSLVIRRVAKNSPAQLSGIKGGDIITGAKRHDEQDKTSFNDFDDMFKYLSGIKVGESIVLFVQRGSDTLEFMLTSRNYLESYVSYFDNEIEYSFVEENGMLVGKEFSHNGIPTLDDQTAYIQLTSFKENAKNEIQKAFELMKNRGKTKLIFDLRDNGGGYMKVLTDVASYFIYNDGKSVNTVAISRGKNSVEVYSTIKNCFNPSIEKISVLANDGTASASECLIGAMLYYGDAFSLDTLVIERGDNGKETTYGKGIMQTTYKLLDGSAFKLTTAKVYWPDNATCIQNKGIGTTVNNVVEKGKALERAITLLG